MGNKLLIAAIIFLFLLSGVLTWAVFSSKPAAERQPVDVAQQANLSSNLTIGASNPFEEPEEQEEQARHPYSVCKESHDESWKYMCYRDEIKENPDVSLCYSLYSEEEQKDLVYQSYDDKEIAFCVLETAKASGDPELCLFDSEQLTVNDKEQCVEYVALATKNASICRVYGEELFDHESADTMYGLCEAMIDRDLSFGEDRMANRDYLMQIFAFYYKDASICSEINDDNLRTLCKAAVNEDPDLCSGVMQEEYYSSSSSVCYSLAERKFRGCYELRCSFELDLLELED